MHAINAHYFLSVDSSGVIKLWDVNQPVESKVWGHKANSNGYMIAMQYDGGDSILCAYKVTDRANDTCIVSVEQRNSGMAKILFQSLPFKNELDLGFKSRNYYLRRDCFSYINKRTQPPTLNVIKHDPLRQETTHSRTHLPESRFASAVRFFSPSGTIIQLQELEDTDWKDIAVKEVKFPSVSTLRTEPVEELIFSAERFSQ